MEKLIVTVGDVHGCIDELNELLNTLQYNSNQMRLVFLGDLMDRGPDPLACVRKVQELGVECIMGNHEEKNIRWNKHEKNKALTGKLNPMKHMSAADAKFNAELTESDLVWLKALPLKLDLGNNWWAVHAGCEPRYPLSRQSSSQIMRVRYVNEKGNGVPLGPNMSQPEGSVYWTENWKGPENIVYGHCVHDLKTPRHDYSPYRSHCLGIDTGCVFGGHLTAALFKEPEGLHVIGDRQIEFVQVQAKQKYSTMLGDD
jgi:bis(5'-nucleosyl)-tetraphosphatase (symmetrical)